MRPQGFSQGSNGLEDLGWNDMGFEPPKAAEAPRDEDHDAFGEDVVASYIKLRQADWNDYASQLTDWERRTTLDC